MLNNYAESGSGFNSNHGQTSRPAETAPKQHNIGSSWSGYNSQLEGMYYSGEQAMYMGPYDGSTKHANYPQYPHQPVPTNMVKCQEACCQHFQDRYPLNPAPLRYQPAQPRYDDSRQYFTDRRSMQPTLSRKKAYPTDNAFSGIPDRHYSQFMNRGQFMPDTRQQMQQMMRSQYPMYPPYWGSTRSYGPRMNCPPPPYHQSVSQGAQLQAGLKMADAHYMDPSQKSLGAQRHRTVGPSGGSEIIRPVPEPKRSALDPNLQSCYEFGYPGGFVPYGEVNKIQGSGVSQNGTSCKIPSDKQYHPHQMQYSMPASDRNMMNCNNPINDLSYSMNFPLPSGDPYIRAGLDDGQSVSDSRKLNLQYDSSLGKKRPDLDLRQYLATWEDDEEEGTRLSEPVTIGNSGAPYIVVDCRSLEGDAAAKIQERFKTSQNCSSKSRSSSPNNDRKRTDEQNRSGENPENSTLPAEFQSQPSFAPMMPNLLNDSDKGVSFWNGTERDGEGVSVKNSAFQPLDCSKRDNNLDHSKRDPQAPTEIPTNKATGTEPNSMSFDNLVSYYGDTRRISDGGYDFVEMTERLVNNPDKSAVNSHQITPTMTRPCDPRLQQSQVGNNPSIYNKVAPRYSAGNFQHFKPPVPLDPYYNFKHPMNPNKYFAYDNSQVLDPNYDYHKMASDFDPARLYSNKDATKDPRRLFHQELDKATEGVFLDPVRKAQLNDCYQDKAPCEFTNGDPNQYMPPIIVKKSDLNNRDKLYSEKNNSIRERMDVINNENQNLPEKTVLITSQNGPPEIFRVPFSPDKETSHKDNVVTLHSGDQTKSNTITVEVPYVQQYSTLVKLSEEISRVENGDGKNKNKPDVLMSNKLTNDETKKPTSFKLKRLPNSKEWAVENKGLLNPKKRGVSESNIEDLEKNSSGEVSVEKDCLNPPVTTSNLNMPSLDDFREEEHCDTSAENLSKNKINETTGNGNKMCSSTVDDPNKSNKYNSQPPQMAIVQPMKLNKCDGSQLQSTQICKLPASDCKENQLNKPNGSIGPNHNSFDPDKLITSTSSHLELMPEDISKHENFRTHKKIQSFPARIPTCLTSPSEDFLHSQEIGTDSHKETYSPFQVYSDCDMNSQINEFFKIDDRNTANHKNLDRRMPSSPSVEGMFEDINHADENNLYQSKTCDFPDLSDSNINSHDAHFQAFSTMFSDDVDRRERLDGSILQMNDRKCLKNMLECTNNEELNKSDDPLKNGKSDESKKSPPIPPISLKLKLNESKKMWCIANKHQHLSEQLSGCTDQLSDQSQNISETLDIDAANELEKDLAQAIDEEKRKSSENYFREAQTFSEINQLLSSETNSEGVSLTPMSNSIILSENIFVQQSSPLYAKASTNDEIFLEETKNNCRTITKYCPRNKIFEKLKLCHRVQTTQSKPLVFDQYGTHFPVTNEEAKLIAKDIIHDLISKSITERYVVVKNNIAHVAPYSENPDDTHSLEEDSTSNCALNLSTSEPDMQYDSSHALEDIQSKESCITRTTELFLHNEKECYQHDSVIKPVPSAKNIVAKLRRPARSIFSPMSDHGKDDDEPVQTECDNRFLQTVSSQEENLLNFGDLQSPLNSNKVGCFDLVNDSENMDLDSSDEFKGSYNTKDINSSVDEVKNSQNEGSATSSKDVIIIECQDHAPDQNSTEIDDALELMGLSNIKSAGESCGSTKYSNNLNILDENNLSYLQESSENETGIEDQLSLETAVSAPTSILQHSSTNSKLIKIPKKLTSSIEIDNSGDAETIETLNKKKNLQLDSHIKACDESSILEDSTILEHTDVEQVNHSTIYHDTQMKAPHSTKIALTHTNVDKCHINEQPFPKSCKQGITNKIKPTTSSEDSECTLTSNLVENKNGVSCCIESDVIKSDEANISGNQIEDTDARLETSVIVRNETFNYISSRNDEEFFQNSHNRYQGSFRSYSESVFNVRNIINDVINYAVSKNESQKQHNWGNPFENKVMNNCEGTLSMEEASPMSLVNEIDSSEENLRKCLSGPTNEHQEFGMFQASGLYFERQQSITFSKASVITSKSPLPLDLSTEKAAFNDFSMKDPYCVSESMYVIEEEPNLFVKINGFSYFNDFKTLKWKRFHKSCFEESQNFKNTHKGTDEITSSTLCKTPTMLIENKTEYAIKKTPCKDDGLLEPLILPNSPSCSDTESNYENCKDDILQEKLIESDSFQTTDVDSKSHETENINSFVSIESPLLRVGGEIFNENQDEGGSTPLKDKVYFFNQKEPGFLRRDSLKILEREAVLREIFSPEPETDNSESKENACPGFYNLHKQESGSKLLDTENIVPNDEISSLASDSTKQKSISFSGSPVEEINKLNNVSHSSLCQTVNSQSDKNKISSPHELNPQSNKSLLDSSKINNKSLQVHSTDSHESLHEPSSSVIENDAAIPHISSYLLQQSNANVHNLVEHINKPPMISKKESVCNILSIKFKNVKCLLDKRKEETSHVPKSGNSPVENKSPCISENVTSIQPTDYDGTLNNQSQPVSPEGSPYLCEDRDILSPDQEDVTDESPMNCADMTNDNMSCHDSNTNDISSKVAPSENANATSLVTGKDVLFSTTQPLDDQDDEALNNNIHHKDSSNEDISFDDEREGSNMTNCQNEKINSVQDSLRNNHHINKETFPLQCLVEAALALEHVGSKQMLLNNSNFPGLYSQSDEGFVESPLSQSPTHESLDYSTKSNTHNEIVDRKKSLQNDMPLVERESFSKFEETNYNLRASTRIVTSSSSNIIPYSKRKYGLKSAKSPNVTSEIKQKKTDTVVSEKNKCKKRKCVFAYPRTKRRRKNTKEKSKSSDVSLEPTNQSSTEAVSSVVQYDEPIQNKFDREDLLRNQSESIEPCLAKEICSSNCSNHCSDFKPIAHSTNDGSHLTDDESKNDFGGPLLIANENTTAQGNIFCVHVDSEKIDDYVNNINVGGLGILSDTNHSLFKEPADGIDTEIPNVSLENSTSLVIIIEDLDANASKIQFDDNCKSESDVMLGSGRDADCSDVLTTELSVNESCICPPDIGVKTICELKSKHLYGRSDELLTTNCYEEINENLINDIGNWPFVEEEVAEFDDKSELPNKIPEEGRKIELKCSLPWKKIFNISKNITEKQEKKNKKIKSSKKSGLELGPAKVEVRLKAPSAEWKVISDYHENSSPVVKVSRLILQRESDNSSSSYSEKDSEEETDNKKQSLDCSDMISRPSCPSHLTENISKNENWQPIVVLKRSKELDRLTSRLQSQNVLSPSNSQSSSSDESKDEESSGNSDTDTSDESQCSKSREGLPLCDSLYDDNLISGSTKKYYQSKFYDTNENDKYHYEKYSPTGCSSSLANEKIYSPSNPHFSPGEVYPDSDMNSDCEGGKELSNNDNGDDNVFLDEKSPKTSIVNQISLEESKTIDIDLSDNSDANKLDKICNTTDIYKPQDKTEIVSQSVYAEVVNEPIAEIKSSNGYLSDMNDPSTSKCMNSEGEMENTPLNYKSSVFSNSSNTSFENNNTGSLRELHYDQTKKTKRKMPKNFFVRKKVRRNLNDATSSDTSSQSLAVQGVSLETMTSDVVETSIINPSIAQGEIQCRIDSLSEENELVSESDLSANCDNSRLHCAYSLKHSSPTRLNESAVPERFEEKRTLRNCGRGLKRPGEGHSREDTKRRRKKMILTNTCRECDVTFKNKEQLTRHNAYRHARRRELHHCLLCQRSFSSAARHSLHVQGRSHRHLELTQRHTMHAIHRLVAGQDCPAIPPLTRAELRALQWRPSQPGYTHIYHDTMPLQTVLQERSSDLSEDTILSGEKTGDD